MSGHLEYVGKTDSDAGLKNRLMRHAQKIQARFNLNPEEVTFKAIRLYVFSAMDLETLLIGHYKNKECPLSWQHSGFGANDPGRKRDKSAIKETHFDAKFPIDLDTQILVSKESETLPVSEVLQRMKDALPYLIRFQKAGGRKPHKDLVNASINVGPSSETAYSLLSKIKASIGPQWQITALPGYIIVYKEQTHYQAGRVIS